MFQSNIVLKAKGYVKLFLVNIDEKHWYYYHNLGHTLDVFERTSYLVYKEWLNEELQELVQIAALFHDTWFKKQYDKNEIIWTQIAEEFLKENNFPEDKIDIIKNIILATIPTKEPMSHLEEMIKDADMDNLWREDFLDKNENLYKELKMIKKLDINEKTWLEDTLKLLQNYKFYTETEIQERSEQFEQNKKELKNKLKNL